MEKFAVDLARNVNFQLSIASQKLEPGQSNTYMTMLKTPGETDEIISKPVRTVYTVAMEFPSIPIVCPPADGTPLGRLLTFMGVPTNRIYSVEIKGTVGTTTGNAQIESGPLPREILQKHQPTIMLDLPFDSGGTSAALAIGILKARNPSDFNPAAAESLRNRLKAANENGNNGPDAYVELARTCAEAELVPVFVLTKSPQFTVALHQVLQEEYGYSPAWREIVKSVLDVYPEYPGTEIPNVWGVGPFDYGVFFSKFRERFAGTNLWNHRLFTSGIRDKDNEWQLRLGMVPGLEYLDHTKNHQENIIDLTADMFAWMANGE